jgi:predicted PurR-regulated permease PerM
MSKSTVGSGALCGGRSAFWMVVVAFLAAFFHLFSNVCFPFVVGFVLAYLCAPIVDFLDGHHLNRTFVCLIFPLCSICLFIFVGMELFPKIKEHLLLLTHNLPNYYDRFMAFLDNTFSSVDFAKYYPAITDLRCEIEKYLNQKANIISSIVEGIASKRSVIANFVSFFIIMPVSFFYFLKDWNNMTKFIYDLVPNRQRPVLVEISVVIRKTFRNFFHGQFYVVSILSIYYVTLLSVINVDKYLFLGIMSGLFSFIPFIGALFSFFLVILLVSIQTLSLIKVYVLLTIYLIGQFFEGYILTPKFIARKTGLHPLLILFSFFAGMELQGVIGVLVAIPLAAVARNLIGFAINKFKASQAYKQ